MSGHAWADSIGLRRDEEPLASLLAGQGVDPAATGSQSPVEVAGGPNLHFRDGRLYAVEFDQDYEPLPAGLSWEEPLPAAFHESKTTDAMTPDTATAQVGPLELQFLSDFGMRFSLCVQARGDLDELGTKPLTAALASSPFQPPAPSLQPAGVPGIPVGYKMSWFAVRSDDVEGIAAGLRVQGSHAVCSSSDGATAGAPFVSAPRDGWRLVLWATDAVETGLLQAAAASKALRTDVCFFASDRVIDSYAWSHFNNGARTRVFWVQDDVVRSDEGNRVAAEPAHVDEEVVRDIATAMAMCPVVPPEPGTRIG